MDISPQRVRSAEFKTVKKGLDPDEVRSFLIEVADELERAQNQSTAMEARARAAVARLQEISEATPPAEYVAEQPPQVVAEEPVEASGELAPTIDQSETISRTLLLAQRTADTAIAEAEAEAARLRGAAEEEATRTIDSTREMSERLIDEARDEARRTGEAERIQVESEVNALLARRDFLESDVDHLETFLVDERSRLRDAASSIIELVERVPSGLGEVRRPLLSASDDEVAPEPAAAPADATVTEEIGAVDVSFFGGATAAEADDSTPTGEAEMEATDPPYDSGVVESPVEDHALELEPEPDQLIIQTDISDEGPTGFSYDDTNR